MNEMRDSEKGKWEVFLELLKKPGYRFLRNVAAVTILLAAVLGIITLIPGAADVAFLRWAAGIVFGFALSVLAGLISSVTVGWYSNRDIKTGLDALSAKIGLRDSGLDGISLNRDWTLNLDLIDNAEEISWCFLSGESVIDEPVAAHINTALERGAAVRLLFADPRTLRSFGKEITVGLCPNTNLVSQIRTVFNILRNGITESNLPKLQIGLSKSIPTANYLIIHSHHKTYVNHTTYLQNLRSPECVLYSWSSSCPEDNQYIFAYTKSFEIAWSRSTRVSLTKRGPMETSFFNFDDECRYEYQKSVPLDLPDYGDELQYSEWSNRYPHAVVIRREGFHYIVRGVRAFDVEKLNCGFKRPREAEADFVYIDKRYHDVMIETLKKAQMPFVVIKNNQPTVTHRC